MAAALIAAAQFAGAAVLGLLFGLFTAAVFLPRGGGPTRRVLGVVGLAVLVLVSGTFWGIAAGLIHPQDSSGPYQSLGVAGNYGLAAGISVGAGLAILTRFGRRGREAVAAERKRARAGRPRPAHRAIRVADYLIGVMICNMLLGYAAVLKMKPTEVSFAHWLGGFVDPRTAALAARGGLMLAGFLYAQLISGAAIKALNAALRSDWAVSRKWNYWLLVPPLALAMPVTLLAPGLLADIAAHFGALWAGYRYTSEPPGPALQTLKLLLRRRRRAVAPRPAPVPPAPGRTAPGRGLDDLRRAFLDGHAVADPGARAGALERILNELFTVSGVAPERPFARHGEQVDGWFTHRGVGYEMAARWSAATERASLVGFGGKPPGGRPGSVRLLLSVGGFTPGAGQAYTSAPVIAMDGGHLAAVLEQRFGLGELLDRMKRHTDQTGHPYLPVGQALAA